MPPKPKFTREEIALRQAPRNGPSRRARTVSLSHISFYRLISGADSTSQRHLGEYIQHDRNFTCAGVFAGKLLSAVPRDGLGKGVVPVFSHGAPLGAARGGAGIFGLLCCHCVFSARGRISARNETRRQLLARRAAVYPARGHRGGPPAAAARSRAAVQSHFRHDADASRRRLRVRVCHFGGVCLGRHQCAHHPCDAV